MVKLGDLKKNKHGGLVLLFMIEYLCAYYAQGFVPIVAALTIGISYVIIWKYNNFGPVVMLILSSRVINGFIFPNIPYFYTIMMAITYYLPSIIFLIKNVAIHSCIIKIPKNIIDIYAPALLYGFYVIIAFILNYDESKSMFLVSLLPFVLFLLYIFIIPQEVFLNSIQMIIYYLRMIFIVSLVIYIMPHYEEITTRLLLEGKPFGVLTEASGTYAFMGIFRNNGIFFDCRILSIFTYLYIYLIGKTYNKLNTIDIVLCTISVLTTLSRGGILVYAIILFGFFLVSERSKVKSSLLIMLGIIGVLCLALYLPDISSTTLNYFATFNIMNENNVLTQRSVMSNYAMEAFRKYPIFGGGLGSLMGSGIERPVYSDIYGVNYTVVTDAYLFSLLGELGIIGTFLFSFQLFKMVVSSKFNRTVSVFLYLGLMIHMLGTDIPNMRMIYFIMLMIIYISNIQCINKFYNKHAV